MSGLKAGARRGGGRRPAVRRSGRKREEGHVRQMPAQVPRRDGSPAEKAGGGMWPGTPACRRRCAEEGASARFRRCRRRSRARASARRPAADRSRLRSHEEPQEGMAGKSLQKAFGRCGAQGAGVNRAWLGGFLRCRPQGQRVQPELGVSEPSCPGQEPRAWPLRLPGMARRWMRPSQLGGVQCGVVPASQEGTGLAPEMEDVRSLEALPARRAGTCGSSQRRRQILQAGASPASPFPRAWACPWQTGRNFSERKPRTGSIFPHGRRRGCCPCIGFRSVSHVRGPDACRWGRTGMPCTCSRLRA